MKKKFSLLMVFSLTLLLISGCSQTIKSESKTANKTNQTNDKSAGNTAPKLAIYMVKISPNLELNSSNLNKFTLQKEPIITEKDIDSYNWNAEKNDMSKDAKGRSSFKVKKGVNISERIHNQGYKGAGVFPFVLTVDNNRIFVGEFYSIYTSVGLSSNIYILGPIDLENDNLVQLFDMSDKDLLHDKRIYNVLKSCGILKE